MAVTIRQLLGDGGRAWTIAVPLFALSSVVLVLDPLRSGNQFPGWLQIVATVLTAASGSLAFLLARNWKIRLGFVGYVVLAMWLTDVVATKWFHCGPPWFGRPVCERAFHVNIVLTVSLMLGLMLLLGRHVVRASGQRDGSPERR